MRVAQVQFTPWDKAYNFDARDINIISSDKVIVKTEMGVELGTVVGINEIDEADIEKYLAAFLEKEADDLRETKKPDSETSAEKDYSKLETGKGDGAEERGQEAGKNEKKDWIKPIMRKATSQDLAKVPSLEEKKKAVKQCKELARKHNLMMKLVDVNFAFDGSRVTFAFIADGRVDFRELVKDLTRKFSRTIRLQQIGIRDEAKIIGDYGHCGRPLCCKGHLSNLKSITSEMAELQQCAHRGSERISGICGRLMCCLAYEQNGYEELNQKMPPLGARVKVDGKRGVVVGHHLLKQTVDVEFGANDGEDKAKTVVEVDLNRHKKK